MQQAITQAEFAAMVGLSEAKVSQLFSENVLNRSGSAHDLLKAYCARLREVAAGRASGAFGGLDLVQERAALAREQRIGQALKNATARGAYAPISLLAQVLATASQAVVERFEQLPGMLRKSCPDLGESAHTQIGEVIARARNEWVAKTSKLVIDQLEDAEEPDPIAQGDWE